MSSTEEQNQGRIHERIRRVLDATRDRPVTLGEVLVGLSGTSYAAASLLLALPFLQPIPTVGLAYPLGLVIAGLGATAVLGLQPWLPATVVDRPVRRELVDAMALVAERAGRLLPSRPRWTFMLGPVGHAAAAGSIASAGILLFLPIPLPLSNFVPALAILLLAAGKLERDGALVLAGHLVNAACLAGLWLSWGAMRALVERLLP